MSNDLNLLLRQLKEQMQNEAKQTERKVKEKNDDARKFTENYVQRQEQGLQKLKTNFSEFGQNLEQFKDGTTANLVNKFADNDPQPKTFADVERIVLEMNAKRKMEEAKKFTRSKQLQKTLTYPYFDQGEKDAAFYQNYVKTHFYPYHFPLLQSHGNICPWLTPWKNKDKHLQYIQHYFHPNLPSKGLILLHNRQIVYCELLKMLTSFSNEQYQIVWSGNQNDILNAINFWCIVQGLDNENLNKIRFENVINEIQDNTLYIVDILNVNDEMTEFFLNSSNINKEWKLVLYGELPDIKNNVQLAKLIEIVRGAREPGIAQENIPTRLFGPNVSFLNYPWRPDAFQFQDQIFVQISENDVVENYKYVENEQDLENLQNWYPMLLNNILQILEKKIENNRYQIVFIPNHNVQNEAEFESRLRDLDLIKNLANKNDTLVFIGNNVQAKDLIKIIKSGKTVQVHILLPERDSLQEKLFLSQVSVLSCNDSKILVTKYYPIFSYAALLQDKVKAKLKKGKRSPLAHSELDTTFRGKLYENIMKNSIEYDLHKFSIEREIHNLKRNSLPYANKYFIPHVNIPAFNGNKDPNRTTFDSTLVSLREYLVNVHPFFKDDVADVADAADAFSLAKMLEIQEYKDEFIWNVVWFFAYWNTRKSKTDVDKAVKVMLIVNRAMNIQYNNNDRDYVDYFIFVSPRYNPINKIPNLSPNYKKGYKQWLESPPVENYYYGKKKQGAKTVNCGEKDNCNGLQRWIDVYDKCYQTWKKTQGTKYFKIDENEQIVYLDIFTDFLVSKNTNLKEFFTRENANITEENAEKDLKQFAVQITSIEKEKAQINKTFKENKQKFDDDKQKKRKRVFKNALKEQTYEDRIKKNLQTVVPPFKATVFDGNRSSLHDHIKNFLSQELQKQTEPFAVQELNKDLVTLQRNINEFQKIEEVETEKIETEYKEKLANIESIKNSRLVDTNKKIVQLESDFFNPFLRFVYRKLVIPKIKEQF